MVLTTRAPALLMFHEVERPGRPLAEDSAGYRRFVVTRDVFANCMDALVALGLRGEALGALPRTTDARTVVLTFDDGNESDLAVAAPELERRGFGATFFVTTGFLDRPARLATAQLRELHDAGFEIGSHGVTHRFLTELEPAALRTELTDSKARLEDLIGAPVQHVSCPGGRWSRAVAEAALAAGYRSVSTSRASLSPLDARLDRLGRIAVLRDWTPDHVRDACRGRGLRRRRVAQRLTAAGRRVLGPAAYERLRSLWLQPSR